MPQTCTHCGKEPTTNFQKLWVKWNYDAKKDDYSAKPKVLDIEPVESENLHLCDGCVTLWEQGEI